jgi:hypothetical protein
MTTSRGGIAKCATEEVIFIFIQPLINFGDGVMFLIKTKRALTVNITLLENVGGIIGRMYSKNIKIVNVKDGEKKTINSKKMKNLQMKALKYEVAP